MRGIKFDVSKEELQLRNGCQETLSYKLCVGGVHLVATTITGPTRGQAEAELKVLGACDQTCRTVEATKDVVELVEHFQATGLCGRFSEKTTGPLPGGISLTLIKSEA